jgi:hypothetical protein
MTGIVDRVLGDEANDLFRSLAIFKDEKGGDAALPWSLSFNYNLAPRNIVLKTEKGYIKTFRPGEGWIRHA